MITIITTAKDLPNSQTQKFLLLRLQGKLANYLPSFTTAWLSTGGQF